MLRSIRSTVCAFSIATASCVLAPPGHEAERERMLAAGRPYADAFEERALPELEQRPTWRELLERAFLANGDLERAYFEWRAAVERVEMAAGWPNTDLMPSFSYLFSSGSMQAWDRTTVSLAFDPSENLELPVKIRKAAEIALAEARAAGEQFRMAKFGLQRRVLEAWLELVLVEERARIARSDLELLRALASTAAARVHAGGPQRDLLGADIEVGQAEDRVRGFEAQARSQRAMLNGLLARDARAPLDVGDALPEPRPLPGDDQAILAAGVHQNPHLASLVEQAAGREGALELARMKYLPNFNPFAAFTGDVSQTVGVGVMLPTTLPEIRSGIAEARALLAAERALVRQAHQDHTAHFVATLTALRDSERQAELFEGRVLPAAELLASTTRQAYAAGSAGLSELIEAQRTLLDVRLVVAEARIERERRAAEIEELTGIDLEALTAAGELSRGG
jgi:outer membrane protein TolC